MAKQKLTKEQKQWRAQDDAYCLAQAKVIQEDAERLKAAQLVAQERANNLKQEAKAMEKVAKSKK